MELEQYNLDPQEQLLVSLYLKSMVKAQALRDSGFPAGSTVFNKSSVKAAIADQMKIRAERLRVGGDWVLLELKRVYELCMPDGPLVVFDPTNAIRALTQIGKHVDVKAFDDKSSNSDVDDDIVERLNNGRQRVATLPRPSPALAPAEEVVYEVDHETEDEEFIHTAVSFMHPPAEYSDTVENQMPLLSEDEKLNLLIERWKTGKPPE